MAGDKGGKEGSDSVSFCFVFSFLKQITVAI